MGGPQGGPPLAPPVCSPSPTPGSPTTHAQTGYTGARLPEPPGAPPRLTPLVSMSITRVTMGSAPQTPPGAPLRWMLGVTLSLTSTASVPPPAPAPHQPQPPPQQQQPATTSWASKEALRPQIGLKIRLVMCKYSLKENIYLV